MYEVWKDVVGYEGLYQVSNKGRIRSLGRLIPHKRGFRKIKSKTMKLQEDAYGYFTVSLYKNKKRKIKKVHRIVAEAFLNNPGKLATVHHKNENKKDNSIGNLEFCSSPDNSRLSFNKRVMGVNSKTKEIIYFNSTREADSYGFNSCNISLCCNGKIQKHRGFKWKYVERK
ncbi:hypothetical protein AQ616_18965 [Oceanobacillus sp. E9]|uniref:NUMOD4 domain-containing protein n=1 Tax=Oceanobacillus sp. E9 TaxID=1742575 RepID=UPI00084EA7D1|nr:NUMOD4 domain-containing protein [Oceanobacillus sp. E9]OEH55920.1 hypothetical protein AQ616_18965 [Oceanobacillus sp. E9]